MASSSRRRSGESFISATNSKQKHTRMERHRSLQQNIAEDGRHVPSQQSLRDDYTSSTTSRQMPIRRKQHRSLKNEGNVNPSQPVKHGKPDSSGYGRNVVNSDPEKRPKVHDTGGARKKDNFRNENSIERARRRDTKKQLNFTKLARLYEAEPRDIVMTISDESNGFTELIDKPTISNDNFLLLLRTLSRAVTCSTAPQSVIHTLIMVSECNVFKLTVPRYLSTILLDIQRGKFDGGSEAILRQLVTITKILFRRMPGKFKDLAPTLNLIIDIVRMLDDKNIDIEEGIKEDVYALEEDRDSEIKKIREGRVVSKFSSSGQFTGQREEWVIQEPTEDFRKIPIFPRLEDVVTDIKPFIRPNKPKGSFADIDDYLDVQFRLLREDFMAPLRDGISEVRMNSKLQKSQQQRLTDVRMYYNVHVLQPDCMQSEGICHEVSLDKHQLRHVQWNHTKRLLYGGLVCLTKDNFQTVMFATVANRDIDKLKRFRVVLKFHSIEDTLRTAPEDAFKMVETTAYFEANRYVLEGLQELGEGKLPFEKYIVYCKRSIDEPQYLRLNENQNPLYDFAPLMYQDWKMPEKDFALPFFRRNRHRVTREMVYREFPVCVLDMSRWPTAEKLRLNESQLRALKTALTKEFAIIQGPPGTGKTHVGLKIMKMLLHNHKVWCRRCNDEQIETGEHDVCSPILIVCYTNHALDQFLEGVFQFLEHGIVRIGSRSKSEILEKFQLSKIRSTLHGRDASYTIRKTLESQKSTITQRFDNAKASGTYNIIHVMLDIQKKSMLTNKMVVGKQKEDDKDICDIINFWLIEKISELRHPQVQMKTSHQDDIEKISRENKQLRGHTITNITDIMSQDLSNVDCATERTIEAEGEADYINRSRMLENDEIDIGAQQADHDHLYDQLRVLLEEHYTRSNRTANAKSRKTDVTAAMKDKHIEYQITILQDLITDTASMTEEEVNKISNVWALNLHERWKLYRYWSFALHRKIVDSLLEAVGEYDRETLRLKEVRQEEDLRVLKDAKVIGMTTTGAAKYSSLLRMVRPKIIVVEEAAEVLESHIITTLTSECQHLILIGDHQQLRPNPTVYRLAKDFNLDMSLFERMIENNLQYNTLNIQHRMRPEIASLMKHIYSDLHNHPSVDAYDDIMGVSSNIYFVNHEQQETFMDDIRSRSNVHEAKFLVAFCHYLLKQGYKPTQISILTMYTAQVIQLKNMMPRSVFEGVRICPVDNFQGEENDIILLSLVRSNEQGQIGFLKIENRVCVALSRAKMGFYCIGNFKLLGLKNQLWKNIVGDLQKAGKIGKSLKIFCRNHPATILKCARGDDFNAAPEGGCSRLCETRLECGHVCTLFCHPYDANHEEYKCRKPCARTCDAGQHNCNLICYKDCGKCRIRVERTIPECGHVQEMYCFEEPENFDCQEKCKHICAKGHPCPFKCYIQCRHCMVPVEKIIPNCEHRQMVPCYQDPQEFRCKAPCEKKCERGHACPLKCHEKCRPCIVKMEKEIPSCGHLQMVPCYQDPGSFKCRKSCQKKCENGHPCPLLCFKGCDKCIIKVEKQIPKCGHIQNVPCYQDPADFDCKQPCPKMCERKHPCPLQCFEGCKDCTVSVQKLLPICNHEQKMRCSQNPSEFKCQDKCTKVFDCGHRCTEKCSDDCPDECQVMMKKKPTKCSHTQTMKCSEDESMYVCKLPCERKLSCTHTCPKKCGEKCANLCHVQIIHQDWSCGHKVKGPCFYTEKNCNQRCGVLLQCRHVCQGLCGDCIKNGIHSDCKWPCDRTLKCGHNCTKLCCEKCDDICLKDVRKIFEECGHKISIKCCERKPFCPLKCDSVLDCGHKCTGICGICKLSRGRHNICTQKCERMLLCGHPCMNKCYEICSVCTMKHPHPCEHKSLGKRCNMRCKWTCVHHQCNNLCWEPCERPPCNNPCMKELKCGHTCVGLCGEMCPEVCRHCHRKKLEAIAAFFGRTYSDGSRFIQLRCKDVFAVHDMDRWMLGIITNDCNRVHQLCMKTCPKCQKPVIGCNRYNTLTKYIIATIDHMNKVPDMFNFVVPLREHLKKLVRTSVLRIHRPLFEQAIETTTSLSTMIPIENSIRTYEQLVDAKIQTEEVLSAVMNCKDTKKGTPDSKVLDMITHKARSLQMSIDEQIFKVAGCESDPLCPEESEEYRSIVLQTCILVAVYGLQNRHVFSEVSTPKRSAYRSLPGRPVHDFCDYAEKVLLEELHPTTLLNVLSTFKSLHPEVLAGHSIPPELNPCTVGSLRTFGKDEWYKCTHGHIFYHAIETPEQSNLNNEQNVQGPVCDQCPQRVRQYTDQRNDVWRFPENIAKEADRQFASPAHSDWYLPYRMKTASVQARMSTDSYSGNRRIQENQGFRGGFYHDNVTRPASNHGRGNFGGFSRGGFGRGGLDSNTGGGSTYNAGVHATNHGSTAGRGDSSRGYRSDHSGNRRIQENQGFRGGFYHDNVTRPASNHGRGNFGGFSRGGFGRGGLDSNPGGGSTYNAGVHATNHGSTAGRGDSSRGNRSDHSGNRRMKENRGFRGDFYNENVTRPASNHGRGNFGGFSRGGFARDGSGSSPGGGSTYNSGVHATNHGSTAGRGDSFRGNRRGRGRGQNNRRGRRPSRR
ncbi:NFX1-type zinc finger-containing protein 1-like [Ptychodera flava]|uniref:NFX1-type zinc finger-containing protein 1-like n=1 Tax=Ptychodera flava TaxID=63121 RepID=UPI003969ED99